MATKKSPLAELAGMLQSYQRLPVPGSAPVHGERALFGDDGAVPDYHTFLFSSGRGVGKTFAGAAGAVMMAYGYAATMPQEKSVTVFAAGPSWSHVLEVMLFEGDSSVLGVLGALDGGMDLVPARKRGGGLSISRNTATGVPYVQLSTPWRRLPTRIVGLSAETPDKWRGKEGAAIWWDEPSVARLAEECWRQVRQLLRKSESPRALLTCTPDHVAPSRRLIWCLAKAAEGDRAALAELRELNGLVGPVVQRSVASWENERMPMEWRNAQREAASSGSAWARQEVLGELVDTVLDALLGPEQLVWVKEPPREDFEFVDLGVDPAVSDGRGDEWGLVVSGQLRRTSSLSSTHPDARVVTLEDGSMRGHTDDALHRMARLAKQWRVRRIVVEDNQGKDVLLNQCRNACEYHGLDPRIVRGEHASTRKDVRADPPATAVRRGVLVFSERVLGTPLVGQLTTWQPGVDKKSPDRVDGWVWSVYGMNLGRKAGRRLRSAAAALR